MYEYQQFERSFDQACGTIVRSLFLVLSVFAIGCDSGFVMTGSVVDNVGTAVSDATVEVTSTDDVYLQPIRCVTDEEGAIFLETFGPKQKMRTVSISVQKSGFAPVKIQLPLGLHTEGVVFELVPLNGESPPLPKGNKGKGNKGDILEWHSVNP